MRSFPSIFIPLLALAQGFAGPPALAASEQTESAVPDTNTTLLWGDMHVHTSNSVDAYEAGKTNADIESAYRYARGLPVVHPVTGARIRIRRPLDFLVIADHAEMIRLQNDLVSGNPLVMNKPEGQRLKGLLESDPDEIFNEVAAMDLFGEHMEIQQELFTPEVREPAWYAQVDAAERHNQPGTFTAFIGWEYTSNIDGRTAHRVVLTPTDGDTAKTFLPYTQYDSRHAEVLWDFLETTRNRTGADFLAIPHNTNLSSGLAFDTEDSFGNRLSSEYASARMTWERLMEITQYKGTSETHPSISPNDEFAAFELRERLFNNDGAAIDYAGSYARGGLLRGLEAKQELGINPYAFGVVGSTDSHTGFSSVNEADYLGKSGADYLVEDRAAEILGPMSAWNVSASGRAAVWARENTREAIFDALYRREVYATTGPRILLQFFGGFAFRETDADNTDIAQTGYRKGVPMGSEITASPANSAPTFLIRAAKDSLGANLDRVQIIKGWRDESGTAREKIYDVAWSDQRMPGPDGRIPAVGNTVDAAKASYKNTIGAAELVTVWTDPDFNPDQDSFYYARVLEIPTPRHHVYDAVALGMDPAGINYPESIQERAYSSPIWYIP